MTTEQLKGCPFCGSGTKTISAVGEVWVVCVACNSSCGVSTSSVETAHAAWNRRTPELSAQTAEPVAWMLEFDSDDENAVTVDPKVVEMWRTQHDNPYEVTPLYTHPAKTEQPSLSDEREEDEYVIDRLSTILAGVSIAFKGEELPLHRHSYHDLAELAKAKMLEIDLLNHQIAELSAARRQDSNKEKP